MAQWPLRTAGINASSAVPALAKFACARNESSGAVGWAVAVHSANDGAISDEVTPDETVNRSLRCGE